MKTNNILSILTIGSLMTLSGCAESQTMGSTVVNSVGSLVTEVVNGTVEGVRQGLGGAATAATKDSSTSNTHSALPANDMVYLFGSMEGGCLGKDMPFQTFDQSTLSLEDSIKGVSNGYDYYVKPRSEWLSEYRDTIKNVRIHEGSEYTQYHVMFKDGIKYRGQPLEEYIFMFRPESSGSGEILKFSSTANITTIWPNFRSYKMEYWDEMIDMGATYNPKNKTITCLFY